MNLSISIFLYIYFAFLIIWAIFALIGVYHIFRFGMKNFTTFFVTFIFLAVSVIILAGSYVYISTVDWDSQISVTSRTFIGGNQLIDFSR